MNKETELMIVYLETIKCNPDYINIIEKDLDRLEKYDKAKELIIRKKVNMELLSDSIKIIDLKQ